MMEWNCEKGLELGLIRKPNKLYPTLPYGDFSEGLSFLRGGGVTMQQVEQNGSQCRHYMAVGSSMLRVNVPRIQSDLETWWQSRGERLVLW